MSTKLLLIDGSSLIHRAFFALPPLTTKKGLHTGAVYGFCNMLFRLLVDEKPNYVAIAFDRSRKTFRTRQYAEYKAQRQATPSELSQQFPLAMELLNTMGIKAFDVADYEADDIIGTLAHGVSQDVQVRIVTGDKDEFQLIKDNVKVFYTKRGISDIVVYDEEEFAKNYEGLVPKQIIDLKGLMGDASDNIPGVPGVGPKTALKLIGEFANVENVLAHIDQVSGKSLKEKLTANKEQALLSKELATICLKAPVSMDLESYALTGMTAEAKRLMEELQFRAFWDKFLPVLGSATGGGQVSDEPMSLFGAPQEELPRAEEIVVATEADRKQLLAKLKAAKQAVPMTYQCEGELPYFDLSEVNFFVEGTIYKVPLAKDFTWLQPYLTDSKAPKALCDAKDLYKVMLGHGLELAGVEEDIALAGYLLEPGESAYTLKSLAERYLPTSAEATVQDLMHLLPLLKQELEDKVLTKLYKEIELPLTSILAQMEFRGIKVDKDMLEKATEDIRLKVESLERLAELRAGEPFNIKSPKQVGILLFERLNLPIPRKTKTGYSTTASTLESIKDLHPVIEVIIEYKKLSKLLSTYLAGLDPLINKTTGRLHTHFQQMVTVTGRLSSTEPNLQNIPARTEVGRKIREFFVPGDGYDYIMSCDYSQVELRVMASMAGDELLLDAFQKQQDVHARTASEVFGVDIGKVTAEKRGKAKTVNFGIIYGISDYGLAQQLGVSRKEAAAYMKSYFNRYTGVEAYMQRQIELARKQGYVETLFGRRKYLPDINSSNFNLRSFAERTAINTPVQGTAADIIKIAMLNVEDALQQNKLKSRVLLQVHDELLLEVVAEEVEAVSALVKNTMEKAVQLQVPLVADVAIGKNWAQAK